MKRSVAPKWNWLLGVVLLVAAFDLQAARVSDVASTRHNLSLSGPGPVRATSESQICVFCHTPHGAETEPGAPLWNRQFSGQLYSTYSSSSIQANVAELADGPGGTSKLCLSCHDGALAISAVNVANGQSNPTIAMQGLGPGDTMPAGEGTQTGFTRNLGIDLTNDHPISFTYDSTLALADGELRDPSTPPASNYIGAHGDKSKSVPLENGELECASCHDPHITEQPDPGYSIKFLRLNRFQTTLPTGGAFSESGDIVCLACHDKLGNAWAQSAHASSDASETYKSGVGSPAELREFPDNIRVWEAACLNCHDTHTVQGARRLLREGTDALGTPKSGGSASIEQVCYQCHTTAAQSILNDVSEVPNIQSDFEQSPGTHMPITSADQQTGGEIHDVTDANLSESRTLLGWGNTLNRHVECTDCHNPHRVLKNQLFTGTGNSSEGTHPHTAGHTNIASGVLRGAWGVEPQYSGVSFFDLPTGYSTKSGDPGSSVNTGVGQPYVTREYQICLKCHSDYGYLDNNVYPIGNRPNLDDANGGTTNSGTNGLSQYTNQAREIQAPTGHRGEGTATGGSGGWATTYENNNHRSWHPVLDSTGRDHNTRNTVAGSFQSPWANDVGTQTMYCSDCHGSNTANGTSTPTGSNPWGPHGSSNDFILKGTWSGSANDLCFKCHDENTYNSPNDQGNNSSGFCCDGRGNLHNYHREQMGSMRCMWCHVAVPHGWKNKALLVNLNDVGPEAGQTAGTEIQMVFSETNVDSYSQEPYYYRARLKILNFRTSGTWRDTDCGSQALDFERGDPDRGLLRGRDWMRDACQAASP